MWESFYQIFSDSFVLKSEADMARRKTLIFSSNFFFQDFPAISDQQTEKLQEDWRAQVFEITSLKNIIIMADEPSEGR